MKRVKPAFLKTFSEFTIEELRAMPVKRVVSLFFQEVSSTFHREPVRKTVKKKKSAKKNLTKPILTAKVKKSPALPFKVPPVHTPHIHINTAGFSAAMRRVFTPGPVKMYDVEKKTVSEKNGKHETVVFSKDAATIESPQKQAN